MSELWQLIWGKPEIDPNALSRAFCLVKIYLTVKLEQDKFKTCLFN
jgi:hypothetical protein